MKQRQLRPTSQNALRRAMCTRSPRCFPSIAATTRPLSCPLLGLEGVFVHGALPTATSDDWDRPLECFWSAPPALFSNCNLEYCTSIFSQDERFIGIATQQHDVFVMVAVLDTVTCFANSTRHAISSRVAIEFGRYPSTVTAPGGGVSSNTPTAMRPPPSTPLLFEGRAGNVTALDLGTRTQVYDVRVSDVNGFGWSRTQIVAIPGIVNVMFGVFFSFRE